MARRRRFGIRARVVASFLVLLTAAEVVSLVVLAQVGTARIEEQVAEELVEATDELRARVASDDSGAGPGPSLSELFDDHLRSRPARADEAYMAFVAGRPFAVSAGAPVALEDLSVTARWADVERTTTGEERTLAGDMQWLAVPVVSGDETLGSFVAVAFVDARHEALRSTITTVGVVTALVLAGACLLAWGLAGRALAPVHELATTARSVTSGDDLDTRIDVTTADEVGDLAASFNEMLDRLQRAFDSQTRFLDGAAHELRAPLTIVRGHLELLDDDPEPRAEEIALVLDEVDRMARLVEELRLLARSERPDFLDLDDVDIAVLVDDVARKARALADRSWEVEAAAGVVRADRQRLTQALLCLVDNAVHVTGPGDRIALIATDTTDAVVLRVRDHGPGIPADALPTLFRREGRAVVSRPGGTGLGLPIVAAVARAHGGDVTVDSVVGAGTTVSMTIPKGEP